MVKLLGVRLSLISRISLLKKIEDVLAYHSECTNRAIAHFARQLAGSRAPRRVQDYGSYVVHSAAEPEYPHSILFIVTANPEILLKGWRDKRYRDTLKSADAVVADGIGVILFARLLYGAKIERISGVDLANEIALLASRYYKKTFLLGGSKDVNKRALNNLKRKSKNLKLAGLGGIFTQYEALKAINDFKPDIVFVALGAPKQEIFIHNVITKPYILNAKPSLLMGIGGTIDFWAYPWLRAPKLMRRIGLEWLWRLILQPWRLPRIINAVIIFPLIAIFEYIISNLKTLRNKP